MTRLTIEIDAEDDCAALRVLRRLTNMMDVIGIDNRIHLTDAGYMAGALDGNGTVAVEHFEDAPEKVKGGKADEG